MTRSQRIVVRSWIACIEAAIRLGDRDAAFHLTVGYVRRLREVGVPLPPCEETHGAVR